MSHVPIRIRVVDDDPVVRRALRDYLAATPGLAPRGESATGHEATAYVEQHGPDVALMDLNMPGQNGVEATAWIRQHHPDTQVLVLTTFADDAHIEAAMSAGASGYLLKTAPPEALADAIRAAHHHLAMMSPEARERWIRHRPNSSPAASQLTPRERQVLAALCRGLSNRQIAQELYLSETTIKGTITHLMHLFGAPSRLKLVVKAHALGLDAADAAAPEQA